MSSTCERSASLIANEPLRDTLLQRALQPVAGDFDFVLLDTPPNLDLVTLNAIMAADWLILPCDVDRESLQSLKRTLEVMSEYVQYRPEVDPETFYRVLITIYDPRDQVMNDWLATQVGPLGPTMFRSRIHRTTALKKARANGITIFDYAQRSRLQKLAARRAITDFDSLTQEVIEHEHTRSHRGERLALANSR
ncbi:MAG: ParA family protein [Pirellulales bacterium]|nr:ParA family protein [Pirellulales bacterium]